MKYVNASDTTHNIKLILREVVDEVIIILYNEFKQNTELLDCTIITTDGITTATFDYDFTIGDSFQFKLQFDDVIYYRGKIKAI